MKRLTIQSAMTVLLLCASTASAATYCGETITSNNGNHTATITCSSLGNNSYQFVFESTDAFTGYNAAGSNFYMNVNGTGGYQVSNHLTQDGNKLSVEFTSTAVPNIYVGDFFVQYSDGETIFKIPTDADFSQVCSGGDQTEPSVLTSIELKADPTSIAVGKTSTITATAKDQYKKTMDAEFTYSVTPEDIGTLTDGVFTAAKTGTATITATSGSITQFIQIEIADIDWSDFLGSAAGDQYANKYKVEKVTGLNIENIQKPSWAKEVGIYVHVASGISNVSVDSGIEGAGTCLYLSAFTAQETEVTIVYAGGTITFRVYYADGITDGSGTTTFVEEPVVKENIIKTIENGQVVIIRDGVRYNVLGATL